MGRIEAQRSDVVLVSGKSQSRFVLEYFFRTIFCHHTHVIEDTATAVDLFRARKISSIKLVVLDFGEIDEAAGAVIEAVMSISPRPFVLAITDDTRRDISVRLFEANVNEVMRMPFAPMELAFRLRARSPEIGLEFEFDQIQVKKLEIASDIVRQADLTDVETRVMHVLLTREGETVSRDELSLKIDKTAWDYGNRKFDVHIGHIRKKLDNAFHEKITLRTVRAAGYKLALDLGTDSNRD